MNLPPWPSHEQDEIDAVVEVLKSGRTNQWTGATVSQFETACATKFSLNHSLAVANGTVAIELALRGLGIGSGDDVLVSSRSFVASASMPMMVAAQPVFADVEMHSGNVTVETLEAARTPNTRCAIVVHLCGWPCDMPAIMEWAHKHNILVIEDCAQSHGAAIAGKGLGSFGHAAAFSFCQDKIMTTGGEGGLVAFQQQKAYERAWTWRDHGKLRAESMSAPPSPTPFRWLAAELGTNFRMTGMQAAIGLVQLGKLDSWQQQREANAATLRASLLEITGLMFPWPQEDHRHAWYQATCVLDERMNRDALLSSLRSDGWPVRSGTCPELYRERVFGDCRPTSLRSVASELGHRSLIMPVHPTCNPADMDRLGAAVQQAAERHA